jgi:murein DD-endopeptidase MepM/ murein hydrolase activator NlpD
MVDHADGVVSRYVHASKLLVKKGQVVDAQTPLGYMGDTGAAHGKHWHIGLENHGMAVDWVPRLNEQENTVTRIPGQQDLINFIRVKREQRSEELKADIRQAQERLEALGRIEEQWPV